jgi:NAD(P)-dependent dehydrogenase (short-subunit alcohol dehydrogenase family)
LTSPDRSIDPGLRGRIVVVTGGGRGLGRALVESFTAAGADVAFSFRESRNGAEDVAQAAQARGRRVFTRRADARVPGQLAAFVAEAGNALGGIDVLVNNVGVFRKTPFGTLTEEVLDEAFDVNVKAAVMASQAAVPFLKQRGGGAIVNVASLGGRRPWRSYLPYCATKAALIMATKCLALALSPEIRVNAVAPGILDPPGAPDAIRARVPAQRFGSHAETVEAVTFLAFGGTYTTGAILPVDGGRELA